MNKWDKEPKVTRVVGNIPTYPKATQNIQEFHKEKSQISHLYYPNLNSLSV